MRTLLVILVAIVLIGGGWYWYSTTQTPSAMNEESMEAAQGINDESMQGGTNAQTNDSMQGGTDAGMEDGTIPDNSGTSVNVNAGASASSGTAKSFTVTGSSFAFAPKTLSVKKGDTVTINFVNSGGTHDFNIDELSVHSGMTQGGASKSVTFVASKAGSFQYYCSVGNHRAMGMWGTLTVTE